VALLRFVLLMKGGAGAIVAPCHHLYSPLKISLVRTPIGAAQFTR
jgi:hypothetical protein